MTAAITPFSLKDTPALIERLLPVQKLSSEVFKERKAGAGQTLVPLGAYWKGRKPLILNKACILGCLLPATKDLRRDLEIFEKLMAMDDESFIARWPRRAKPREILATLTIACIADYFVSEPPLKLPDSSPVEWSKPEYQDLKVYWRDDISELERRQLEAQLLPKAPYRERVEIAKRPEEVIASVHAHIWDVVNTHLNTNAHSFSELVEQLGIMRFGHRPCVADTFCGSGQIPFEAARLGCDVYASDLNPIACMLTWGSIHVIGGSQERRCELRRQQKEIVAKVLGEIDALAIETDGKGWRAKAYLYCLEIRCPQSGWLVPMLPSRIISYGKQAIAVLVPDAQRKRYDVKVQSAVSPQEMAEASKGTVRSDGPGQDPYLIHTVDGVEYRTKIPTLRGDYSKEDGSTGNNLRLWGKNDFKPRLDDIMQERLYAVHWMRPKPSGKKFDYEFRSVTDDDMRREQKVEEFLGAHLMEWQAKGWIPDMRIEPGAKTDEPIRTRGWTYWHHLFPPRHLLILGLLRRYGVSAYNLILLCRILNYSSKLCIWSTSKPGSSEKGGGGRTGGGSDNPVNVFYNQALNTLFNYGCRASLPLFEMLDLDLPGFPCISRSNIICDTATELKSESDLYITDPPYGDAVCFDEILEFFIAWLRKNPPPEFSDWVWDSRRSLAIKGEGEDFRRGGTCQ
jgi:putative DNA methylase